MSVFYSPEARADLLRALQYLLERNPAAARKLQESVERLVDQLDAHQFDGHSDRLGSGQTVRSWPLPPWRLYYQRRPGDELWIVRFYHQRRLPLARPKRPPRPRKSKGS